MTVEKIIKEKQCSIIDVRSPGEFRSGNVTGSVNIPLQELPQRMEELENMKKPLVLCCASGGRSAQAHRFLAQQGIQCFDGGSWMDVNYYLSQTT